jgi:hypothetical protein
MSALLPHMLINRLTRLWHGFINLLSPFVFLAQRAACHGARDAVPPVTVCIMFHLFALLYVAAAGSVSCRLCTRTPLCLCPSLATGEASWCGR